MSAHSLREIKPTDATWIFEACQDEQIQYWTTVPKPYLMEHAVGFANGQTSEKKVWVIEDSTKKEVGVISIHGVGENGNAEIGYWVAPWGRGAGATKDAIKSLAEYAKTQPDIKSIQATISDLNITSQKVAIAAGLAKAEAAAKTCPAGGVETTATYYRKAL
ncbi:MAG: GNAT family N-acetyltransferase [Actinomycetes bacterium]|jgi:RimJ/RimL family protein N-acetyltransferase